MRGTTLVIMMVGTFVFWGYVVYAIVQWRKSRQQSHLQQKLIDKFNTVPELSDFLQSDTGNKFLNLLASDSIGPKQKLLASIYKGIILAVMGIAFFTIAPFMSALTADTRVFQAVGLFVLILGAGFILSAFISYKISQKWGIIAKEKENLHKEINND